MPAPRSKLPKRPRREFGCRQLRSGCAVERELSILQRGVEFVAEQPGEFGFVGFAAARQLIRDDEGQIGGQGLRGGKGSVFVWKVDVLIGGSRHNTEP